jgi:aldose 1-epimerase
MKNLCSWPRMGILPAVLFATFLTAPAQSPHETRTEATVSAAPFGVTKAGEPVKLYTLKNSNGLTAKVMTYGAILYSMEIPDGRGQFVNVTLNRQTLADYEAKSACFGALLGRYANRIAGAQFPLEGREVSVTRNAGPNHIHGGARGFDKRVWKAEPLQSHDAAALKLSYTSADGEEGYPGTLTCTVLYELNNQNEWKMDYSARTDKATPVNLSNHAYWNLAGAQSGNILQEVLTVNARQYLLVDQQLIPTGDIIPVRGTPLDFGTPRRIGERMGAISGKQFGGGYDHCLVLDHKTPGDLTFCAKLVDSKSGRTMEVWTTQPSVQLYSANFPDGSFEGVGGYAYPSHAGFCLETQHFPDSPNHPNFPSTILRPGQTYHETTVHKFKVER